MSNEPNDDALIDIALAVADGGEIPWEEVRDWFHAERNYVDALDLAAEAIAEEMGEDAIDRAALEDRLGRRFGINVVADRELGGPVRAYDPDARLLRLDPALPEASQRFALAHQLARLEFAELIRDIAENAREQLRQACAQVFADAGNQLRQPETEAAPPPPAARIASAGA